MKIIILDTYYAPFLQGFYNNLPEDASFSYNHTKARIMDRIFGTSDFYSKNLIKLGHQAEEIIVNDKILQKKWASEHGDYRFLDWADGLHIPFTHIGYHSNWSDQILMHQILEYRPDVLYCQNLGMPGVSFLNKIKKQIRPLIVGQVASPVIFDKESLSVYDIILTSFPHFVPRFKKLGIKSEYFRIGFEKTVLSKLKKSKKQFPVTFVGGFSRHHNNETVFEAATDVWGYGRVPVSNKSHGEAWGIDMYNVLFNSKITLNRHIDTAENHANNMRLYEATGVGTMLITDYKKDLDKLFIPGKEVETYKTAGELADKVKYYLSHDNERLNIAKAGQRCTLRDHSYKNRMQELIKILNKCL